MNFYNHHIRTPNLGAYSKVILLVLLSNFAQCVLLCADFLGNQQRAKFESNTNRMTFEYAPNKMIVKVHPLCNLIGLRLMKLM